MNTTTSASVLGLAALAAMLGCSTSQPVSRVSEALSVSDELNVPPPEISMDLPLEPPDKEPGPRFCTLGRSCLAMDPRPFEPCLLDTRECREKVVEPQRVVEPEWIDPSTIMIRSP